MYKVPNSTTGEAKLAGIDQGLEDIVKMLNAQWEQDNEVFMLFRSEDSDYQDPRTDYTLGRRMATERAIEAINAIIVGRRQH